jgi:hypothetical protein
MAQNRERVSNGHGMSTRGRTRHTRLGLSRGLTLPGPEGDIFAAVHLDWRIRDLAHLRHPHRQ